MLWRTIFMAIAVHIQFAHTREHLLRLKSNAPAIKGSVVKFTADLLELNGTLANVGDNLKWEWLIDDHQKQEIRTDVPHVEWTYQFPKHSHKNPNKTYKLEVSVGQWYIFFAYPVASASLEINITDTLNGEINLSQNSKKINSLNVSTDMTLDHKLEIRREDLDTIENATSTVVHWYVDCQYVRQTKEFKTQHTFAEPNKTHQIEALIEASFESSSSKTAPTLKSKLVSSWRAQHKSELPYICNNQSKIAPDSKKVYGYFKTNVTVFDSISNLVVNGTTWINDGDDYELNIYCSGSPSFEYCIRQIDGPYIMDGNEMCEEWTTMDECQKNFKYPQSVLNVQSFTVLVIVRNAVSIERKLFVVNIKQPIILVAATVGAVVFTFCIIAAVAYCLVSCIRKKRRTSKKTVRSDAESTLIGNHPSKDTEAKLISNKIRS